MKTPTRNTYQVAGMNCDHCRSSVLEEVGELSGVSKVEVDLTSGRLEVEAADVSPDQIRTAVELAGYKLEEAA